MSPDATQVLEQPQAAETTVLRTTEDFFDAMYGDDQLIGSLVISRFSPRPVSRWCGNVADAVSVIEEWSPESDVYFGVGLQGERVGEHSRGDAATVVGIPGFYADIDIGKKASNSKVYPPALEDALLLVREMPFPPTLLICSGGGLHAYWLFSEVWCFATNLERERARRLSEGWTRLLKAKAKTRGWDIDSTYDLARVLRPLGSLNHVHGEARPVTVHSQELDRRYSPDDFDDWEALPLTPDRTLEPSATFVIPTTVISESQLGAAFAKCMATDPHFRAVWNRSQIIGDGSPSVYTFAIGCCLHRAQATPQEIVSAMVSWRHKHGGEIETARWYEQELARIAQKAKEQAAGYMSRPGIAKIDIGPATLSPGSPRKTATGKIVVPVTIGVGGNDVDHLNVSSSTSGRSQAAKAIAVHSGTGFDIEISAALGKLLVDANRILMTPAVGGRSVREIVFELVPSEFRLSYRTESGAWSESLGREVSRAEFTAYCPERLFGRCMSASDAPRSESGVINDSALLRRVDTALRVLWSTLLESLPTAEAEADLDADTNAAERFRQAIIKLWSVTQTFEVATRKNGTSTDERASRSSMAGRVISQERELASGGRRRRQGWIQVQNGFAAWWRPHVGEGGEMQILLAMRYTLADQMRISVPGATNQTQLRNLGIKYGVFTDKCPVSDRLTDSNRLVVLSVKTTKEILAEPIDDPPEQSKENETDTTDSDCLSVDEEFEPRKNSIHARTS